MNPTKTRRIDWETIKRQMPELQASLEQASESDAARLNEIRRERAVRLATPPANASEATNAISILTFKLDGEAYGIELQQIARVFPTPTVTPVPGSPVALLGIANLQGTVRSVFDLRRILSLPEGGEGDGYVLLLRYDRGLVGVRVEQLLDVQHTARSAVAAFAADSSDRIMRYVQGVTPDKVSVLDVDALLGPTSPCSPTEYRNSSIPNHIAESR